MLQLHFVHKNSLKIGVPIIVFLFCYKSLFIDEGSLFLPLTNRGPDESVSIYRCGH